MLKITKVSVQLVDQAYEAMVVVYRHVATPDEITVRIENIRPLPPVPLVSPPDDVCKVLKGGASHTFLIEKTYPYDKGELGEKDHAR